MSQADADELQRENNELRQQLNAIYKLMVEAASHDVLVSKLAEKDREIEALRRQNIELRRTQVTQPTMLADPRLLNALPVDANGKWAETLVGASIYYRNGPAEDVHAVQPIVGFFPGTIDAAHKVIPQKVQWIINCAPTPEDLSGDLLFGVDVVYELRIMSDLARIQQSYPDQYAQSLTVAFDEYWQIVMDMPEAPDKKKARDSFRLKSKRTYEHWANRVSFIDIEDEPI